MARRASRQNDRSPVDRAMQRASAGRNPVRNLMLAVIISVSVIAPVGVRAGEQPLLVQQAAPAVKGGFDRGKAFAIGAGLVIGATAASVLSFRGATIVGAVAGGVIGAWWYGDRSEFATLEPRKP
jgi:hypothetical protein